MKKSIKIIISTLIAWAIFIVIFKLQGIKLTVSLEWALFMAIQLFFFLVVDWSKNIKVVNYGILVMSIGLAIIVYFSVVNFSIFLRSEFPLLFTMLIFTLFYRDKLRDLTGPQFNKRK